MTCNRGGWFRGRRLGRRGASYIVESACGAVAAAPSGAAAWIAAKGKGKPGGGKRSWSKGSVAAVSCREWFQSAAPWMVAESAPITAPPAGATAATASSTDCALSAAPCGGDVALWMAADSCRTPSMAGCRRIVPAAGGAAPLARLGWAGTPDAVPIVGGCASCVAGACGVWDVGLAADSCRPPTSDANCNVEALHYLRAALRGSPGERWVRPRVRCRFVVEKIGVRLSAA